jgi:hypothetical protein
MVMKNVNNFWTGIVSFARTLFDKTITVFDRVGTARAAAELDRLGYRAEAKRLRENLHKNC